MSLYASDTFLASITSAGGTAAVAAANVAGQAPVPEGLPQWLPFVFTVLGPVLTLVVKRLFAASAAKKRALAKAKAEDEKRLRARVEAIRADGNPANDAVADRLEEGADKLHAEVIAAEAEAAALEAAKGP